MMAKQSKMIGGKLVKVAVLALFITRSAYSTKLDLEKFENSSTFSVTYEDKVTKYASNLIACLLLCKEGCRFVEYSDSGPDTEVCGLYYLKDTMYGRLKNLTIASGYVKVYPAVKVFIGMPDHLNWANSKENCESFGWKLASAESSSLLNRTKTLMQGNDFWLGATKESGVWRWLSDVPMSTLPIEDNIDTCLLIWGGRLDDGNCVDNWKMHVCEISF